MYNYVVRYQLTVVLNGALMI